MISRFATFCFAALSFSVATRADTPAPEAVLVDDSAPALLWPQAPLKTEAETAISQRQFAEHAAREIDLVGQLRAWRELFRDGSQTRRDLVSTTLGTRPFRLGLGASGANASGAAGAGLSARWNGLELGTTLRPRALDEVLARFDGAMSGENARITRKSQVSWLGTRRKLRAGEVELSLARGGRDADSPSGTFWSGQGRFQLPARWGLNASARASRFDGRDIKTAWQAEAQGPLVHPWGEASAQLEWRQTEAGWADLTRSQAMGERVAEARLTQEIKRGPLQAQLRVAASQHERDDAPSGESSARDASGALNAQVQLAPTLTLRAEGAWSLAQTLRQAEAGDAQSEEKWSRNGDLSLEWQAAQSLSLGLKAGRSQEFDWRAAVDDNDVVDTAQSSGEDRFALELKRAGKARWSLALGAREREASARGERRLATLKWEAARRIWGLDVQTALDLARPWNASWSDGATSRRASAQFGLAQAARLNLHFRDGETLPGDWSDALGALGGSPGNGTREFGARLGTGSAAGGNGFGLALEWARNRREETKQDNWKVGITYR